MRKIQSSTALVWISLLVLAFWSSVSLGQLVRVQIDTITVYPHDFIVVLLCGKWLWNIVATKHNVIKWLRDNGLVAAMVSWILLGWLIAQTQNTLGSAAVLSAIRLGAYAVAVTQLFTLASNYFSAWYGKTIIFFTTFLMTCWGILQYVFVPDTRFLHIFGWDDHYYRLVGPLLDPNFAGMLAVIAIWSWYSLGTKLLSRVASKNVRLVLYVLISAVCIAALAMTFSRSSWLAFGGSIVISLIFTSTVHRLTAVRRSTLWILLLVVVYWLLPKPTGEGVDIARTASVAARSSLSQQLINSWSWQDWLIGRGLFNVRPNIDGLAIAELERIPNTSRQPDNLIVQLIGSIGLAGTILLVMLLKKNQVIAWLTPESVPLLTAWFIHAQFNNSLFQPQLWILFVTYIALQRHETKQEKLVAEVNG